jgi:OOP family OmpA-OmpF porin
MSRECRHPIGRGVSASRLAAVGYGEAQPIASNDTEEGRSLNRRVELKTE